MIWKVQNKIDQSDWHKWFAWYPITILEADNTQVRVWLECVERKLIYGREYDWFEYHLMED